MSWRLGFGGTKLETGYGLALGYRSADPDLPSGRLLELDVSDRAAVARFAGLPLFARNDQVNQDGDAAIAVGTAATPWYTRQWVYWTAGGIAATLALTGGDGSVEYGSNNTVNAGSNSSGGCPSVTSNGQTVVQQDCPSTSGEGGSVVGTNDDGEPCAVEGFGDDIPDACVPTSGSGYLGGTHAPALAVRAETAWLDAGTGWMGDLVAR